MPLSFCFPCSCLKCASPKVEALRNKRFSVAPTLPAKFTIVFFPIALILIVLFSQRARLELPVCDECYRRWRTAALLDRLLSYGSASLVVGLVLYSALNMDAQPGWGAVILALLMLAAAWITQQTVLKPRLLSAREIDDSSVTLVGVNARVGEQIARSAP